MKLGHLSYSVTLERCATAELWVRLNGPQVSFGVRPLPTRINDSEWPKHYSSLDDAHEVYTLIKETSHAQTHTSSYLHRDSDAHRVDA